MGILFVVFAFLIFLFMKANESLRGLGLRLLIFAVFGQRV